MPISTYEIKLEPEQEVAYRLAFAKLDPDYRGRIHQGELKELMAHFGFNLDDQQINEIVRVADENNSGTIELNEFLKLMKG